MKFTIKFNKETSWNNKDVYRSKSGLLVMIEKHKEGGLYHLSISHPKRLPCYDELKQARYQLLPDVEYMILIKEERENFQQLRELGGRVR